MIMFFGLERVVCWRGKDFTGWQKHGLRARLQVLRHSEPATCGWLHVFP